MKSIISFFYALFTGFFNKLYQFAEAKFTLGAIHFYDNGNYPPAPQGVNVPFNNEPLDIWMAYDSTLNTLLIYNYNRTVVLLTQALVVAPAPNNTFVYFDETQSTPVTYGTNSDFNKDNNFWIATYLLLGTRYIVIVNHNRTVSLGQTPLAPSILLARDLSFLDNANNVPSVLNCFLTSPAPFNQELDNLWIGYHRPSNTICITNYNRLIILGCLGGLAP